MAKSLLKLVTPATQNRTLTPKRPPNGNLRTREYLTESEVERLMKAAKDNRWGQRDSTMILVAYRHGLPCRRTGGPTLGSGGFPNGQLARPQGQGGYSSHAPDHGRRTKGAAKVAA